MVVAHEDAGCSSVSAYLGVPLYYPLSDSFGSFIVWNKKRLREDFSVDEVIAKGDSVSKALGKPAVFLLTNFYKDRDELRLVDSFSQAVERPEQYYIYERR